ncbi:MAG: diguanylate cyclase [Nevskia sp.]|nr:diguanylate cyclase [Nevskia sp.]
MRQPALYFPNHVLRQITIPVGVAVSPEDGTSVDVLIDAADEALYRAKQAGRDRVVNCGSTA